MNFTAKIWLIKAEIPSNFPFNADKPQRLLIFVYFESVSTFFLLKKFVFLILFLCKAELKHKTNKNGTDPFDNKLTLLTFCVLNFRFRKVISLIAFFFVGAH